MSMKRLFLICSSLLLLSCGENKATKELFNPSSLDHLELRDHADLSKEPICTAIHLTDQEKKEVAQWIESSRHLNKIDFVSYVPHYILSGDGIDINFLDKTTVINYKDPQNPKAGWKQYSRERTEEDQKILNLLKGKSGKQATT